MVGLSASRGRPSTGASRRKDACAAADCGPRSLPQISAALAGEVIALRLGNAGGQAVRFEIETEEASQVEVVGEQVVTLPVGSYYHLAVVGPDHFRFELVGCRDGRAAGVDVQARHTVRGVDLELRNGGPHEIQLHLRSRSNPGQEQRVRVAAGGAQPFRWPAARGAYDLEITTPDDETFHRRITGRTAR